MKVLYRVSDKLSPNPNPLGKNKQFIIDTCLNSFKLAGESEITFIVDGNPKVEGNKIQVKDPGKENSLITAFDEAIKLQDNEKVLLCEDDYLWRPGCLEKLSRALNEIPLISPYDHPGHYIEERFKFQPKLMKLIDNQTYRQAPSNTHTFACMAWVIKQNYQLMKDFGVRDHEMFTALGIPLYVPVPSFATHLVTGLLAPNVVWDLD